MNKVPQLGALKPVRELQGREYRMVQQDQDVESTLDDLGISDEDGEYLYLLVKEGPFGECDYQEVWGMYSADLSVTAELIYIGG